MPPNIVVFLVDDMGWQDTSLAFHGRHTPLNHRYHTPNMERLADSGVKFTQAYACSVCSPSRVSLMTGLNAARHRVTNWTLHRDRNTDPEHPELVFPEWNVNGLSPDPATERAVYATALPALLRQAGYRTIHVGKAHFGALDTPGADPRSIGFDINIAGHAAGGPGSYLSTQNFSASWRGGGHVWDVPGLDHYHGQDIFLTEALTIEANRAMDQAVADGVPFFLYMSHYAVHVPFAEDKRFIKRYLDAGLDYTEAQYAALLEGMDKSLGDILDNLQRRGLADNTVVLFMSDNGGLSAHGRGGQPHTHNKPLSSGKGSAHEGGIREPMIARWPGVTRGGTVCAQPVIIEDFFPTILELAGAPGHLQPGGAMDGVSFAPLLRGEDQDGERSMFWHYPNNWGPTGPGIGASSTIRRGDWKLIYYHADQRYELHDVANDIGETRNLAQDKGRTRTDLAAELREYLAGVNAQMPIRRASGEPVPLPD
jgi:arylsulfatase A-like enzyme